MDLLSASTVLTTLVGLLCNFRQEKGTREALDHRQFIEWLDYHRHEELKNLVVNTEALRAEVDNLLRAEHSEMLRKLDQISGILVALLSRLDEFRGLTAVLSPNFELSEQAISILRQFVNSGQKEIFVVKLLGGHVTVTGGIKVDEPRFLDDDLDTLVRLDLLSFRSNSQGNPVYGITRNAVKFVRALDEKKAG